MRHRLPVEREAGAGDARPIPAVTRQRAGQRIGEAAAVPLEHLDVGQQVMREQHRLGRLHVSVAGHDRIAMRHAEPHQRTLQAR